MQNAVYGINYQDTAVSYERFMVFVLVIIEVNPPPNYAGSSARGVDPLAWQCKKGDPALLHTE